jgi:hypothetical protein
MIFDQSDNTIMDLFILRDKKTCLNLCPVTESEVGEEDLVHFVLLGFAMRQHELFGGLSGRNLAY